MRTSGYARKRLDRRTVGNLGNDIRARHHNDIVARQRIQEFLAIILGYQAFVSQDHNAAVARFTNKPSNRLLYLDNRMGQRIVSPSALLTLLTLA